MGEWFNNLSGLEKVFFFCAALGSVLFLIRLALQFLGGDDGGGEDIAEDIPDDLPDDIGDSDVSFRFISIQGIIAFVMIFGLVGLAMKRNSMASDSSSLAAAAAAGLAVMWLLARFMASLLGLQSSGNLRIDRVIGGEGTVYLDIPAQGTGKVRVVVQNRLKVFDATSKGAVALQTGEQIKVIRITSGNVLVVEKSG